MRIGPIEISLVSSPVKTPPPASLKPVGEMCEFVDVSGGICVNEAVTTCSSCEIKLCLKCSHVNENGSAKDRAKNRYCEDCWWELD